LDAARIWVGRGTKVCNCSLRLTDSAQTAARLTGAGTLVGPPVAPARVEAPDPVAMTCAI
jgi:hypothetical protein